MDSSPPIHSPATTARQQPVNATISRDFAGGNLARETVVLQSLVSKSTSANKGSTGPPTAAATLETPQGPAGDPVGLAFSPSETRKQQLNGNNYLQDYQVELMIQERHNKERLMLARGGDQPIPVLERREPQQPEIQINPLKPSLTSHEPIPTTGTTWQPDMERQKQHSPELKRRRPVNDENRAAELDESAKRMKQTEPSASNQGFLVSGLQSSSRCLCQLSSKFIDVCKTYQ